MGLVGLMAAQPPLPLTPAGGVPFGKVTALLQDNDGGRAFIRGELCFAWDAGDEGGRRLAAVQLVRIKAASSVDVAATETRSSVACETGTRHGGPAWPAGCQPRHALG